MKNSRNPDMEEMKLTENSILKGEMLTKRYDSGDVTVFALREASFEIKKSEFVVVLGPSGSGKSTLLNMLGGMDIPTEGKIWFESQELTSIPTDKLNVYRRDSVGFVFQFFNLISSLTAIENVELAASISQGSMDPYKALEMVGLTGREKHFPSQLSGGEQQRVSIARAIVKNPKLLLCDEPTGALDSKNGAAVVKLLIEMRDSVGCSVVTITHNQNMAAIADRVFHMKDGRIEAITENPTPCSVEELVW